jgi:hypothetical protein
MQRGVAKCLEQRTGGIRRLSQLFKEIAAPYDNSFWRPTWVSDSVFEHRGYAAVE